LTIKVQILGVEGSAETEKLRGNVKEALEHLGYHYELEQITKLEDFMKFKINGIPALIVNDTVVLQRHVPDLSEIISLLKVFNESTHKPFGLSKILVPTDFSDTSKVAFHFAQHLAHMQHGVIKLINVNLPEYDPNNPYVRKPAEDLMNNAMQRLEKFSHSADTNSSIEEIQIICEVDIGFPVEEIVRQSIIDESDLIVLGTTGEKGFLEKIFGSVSTSVAQRAKCPVMMIPSGLTFKPFRKILYAFDYSSANDETIHRLLTIAGIFSAQVHFIHVTDFHNSGDFEVIKQKLERIFDKEEPQFPCCISKIEGHSVADSLNNYAIQNNIDLVVIVKPQRSFWENIFHRSVTKSMTLNTKLPILVLKD
jgi:nucleotide-binding universal stress UspA family protein